MVSPCYKMIYLQILPSKNYAYKQLELPQIFIRQYSPTQNPKRIKLVELLEANL